MIDKLTVTFILGGQEILESEMHRDDKRHDDRIVLHELKALLQDVHTQQGRILRNQETIMTAISDYAAANKTAFAAIATSLDGVEGDLQTLADKITEMNNNPGPISPADQILLDESQALATALVARVAAIDAKNPPVPAA